MDIAFDLRIAAVAAVQDNIIDRADVLRGGGSDAVIIHRLATGRWRRLHPGVYLVGAAPPTWPQAVRAAVVAGGPDTVASHRAALLLWGLDGLRASPPEITSPFTGHPQPAGVVCHRSRRIEPVSIVHGIATTSVERTLLEVGAVAPAIVVEKAFSSAWRRNLTSPAKCRLYLDHHGGRGRRGVGTLRRVVDLYEGTGRPAGSDGEVAFLRALREAGIEEPVRQFLVVLPDGSKASVDFAWPQRRKLIEFVGLEVHADARAHAQDTLREDDILTVTGWELRRYAPETLRKNPEEVARRVLRFLCRPSAAESR